MALLFGGAGTDRVDCGNDASLTNLSASTRLMWVQLADAAGNERLIDKGGAGARRSFFMDNANIRFASDRATTPVNIEATHANFAAMGLNKWVFVAVVYDEGGANGDQLLLIGDLSTAAAEPSAYVNQLVGTGAGPDDSGATLTIANRNTNNLAYDGPIAWTGIWDRVLTTQEIIAQQFRPHVTDDGNCVLFMHLGFNGTGTQADWTGTGNNGTVTGTSIADHVPLGPSFGFDIPLLYAVGAPPAGTFDKLLQFGNLGADLYNGALI